MKPFIAVAAEALGVSHLEAIGLFVQLWGRVAHHARRGDVSSVPDSLIEQWAGWTRKRGKFAAFVRAQGVDSDGRIREWESYAGHLEDRREREDSPDGKSTYVYYAIDGEQCKIGWSGNPWSRIHEMRTARPGIQLAATERGTRELERDRHREFESARIEREWFTLTPALVAHVRRLGVVDRSHDRSSDRSEDRSSDDSTTNATTEPPTVAAAHTRARANGTERNGTERYVTTPLNSESRENSNRRSGADLDPERATAPPAPPASGEARHDVERFLATFYRAADDRRRTDVARQILETLTPAGAKLRRGEHVHAGSVERLVAKLRETVAEGVKDPDKAITVLLIKLGDTSDVSAQHAADVKRDEQEAEAEQRQNLGHALAWLADHRDVEAAIDRELAVIAASIDGNLGDVARRFERHARVLAAWREAGAPRAEHVASTG